MASRDAGRCRSWCSVSPEKGPASGSDAGAGRTQQSIGGESFAHGETALKKHRVIRALLAGPLHRFQAERFPISDHALPSTISELRRDGLDIDARRITVAGYGGKAAHLAEYTLAPESRSKAIRMLGAVQ